MNPILVAAGFGMLGALARLLIVCVKTLTLDKKITKDMMIIYGVSMISIGAFSGIVLSYGKMLSFLAGYAGIDLLNGYYKIFTQKLKIK